MDLDFKDLLNKDGIDPRTVLVLRHTPTATGTSRTEEDMSARHRDRKTR